MRHYRRTNKAEHDAHETRLGKNELCGKATADGGDEGDNQSLDVTETFRLQEKHRQHVESGNDAAPDKRDTEKKLQGDGGTDHFRQIASRDGYFTENPKKPDRGWRVMISAGLGQVAPCRYAQFDAQMLEQNCH